MKYLVLTIIVFSIQFAHCAEDVKSSTTKSSGTSEGALASFSMELELDNQISRNEETNDLNGISSALAVSNGYNFNEVHNLLLNAEMSFLKVADEDAAANLEAVEVGYSREFNIEAIGTTIAPSLLLQGIANKDARKESGQDGLVYLRLETATEITPAFALETEMVVSKFLTSSDEDDVVDSGLEFQVNPVYSFGNNASVKMPIASSFEFTKGGGGGFSSLAIAPTFGYAVNDSFEFEIYLELVPLSSYDGQTFASNFHNEFTTGATFILSVL
ncbi:MAG: hypothetical protein ISR65_12225 [Bacteriovoracaceae bacterium]|nr:hypothetical protein [Bacteriovoracaceae bacterium]